MGSTKQTQIVLYVLSFEINACSITNHVTAFCRARMLFEIRHVVFARRAFTAQNSLSREIGTSQDVLRNPPFCAEEFFLLRKIVSGKHSMCIIFMETLHTIKCLVDLLYLGLV